MKANLCPAYGRALRGQVWWKRFVVIAGTDTFDLAVLTNRSSTPSRHYDISWCTNDSNIPHDHWKTEAVTLEKHILGDIQVANPSGHVFLGSFKCHVWDVALPLPGLHGLLGCQGKRPLTIAVL